jgi:hypothetical protein
LKGGILMYEILKDFGVFALIGAIFVAVIKVLFSQIKGVKLGVKALLRARMIDDYNEYIDKGYAPIYVKQNFQNCWEQYHAIKGPNGVMDDIHEKFIQLPTEPQKEDANGD